ncbi:MAG TPA: protein tyrosine kinase [Cyanobacteria bacterium UBA11370]|nr:protein tyrosine kinase [Cyanobacteria bacterium UBA11370]
MDRNQTYLVISPSQNGKPKPERVPVEEIQLPEPENDVDLRWLWGIIKRRILVIFGVAIAVTAGVGWWTFHQEPKYEGKFNLLVEPVAEPNKLDQLNQVPGLADANVQTFNLDYDTQIEVLRSPEVLEPFIKQISTKYPDVSYESLIGENKLIIRRLKETKILEISYQDTDPKKIQFLLFELAKIYLRYSFQERQSDLSQGIRFVEGQLPELRQRVDKLQEQLQQFRQQYNLLDPEQQAKQLSEQVRTLEQQRLDTQLNLNNARTLYRTLQGQLGLPTNQAIAASYLSEAPRYQQLLNQLQDVEIKLATESARFLGENPTIERLQEQRRNLLPLLQNEAQQVLGRNLSNSVLTTDSLSSPSSLRLDLTGQFVEAANQIQVLEIQQSALALAGNRLNQQVKQMPFIARKYTDLQRELNVATDSLNRFLAARETLQIDAAQKTLPWKLLSKPKEPKEPILPQPEQNLILAAIAGLFLGVGAALLAEQFDNVFRSPEELKDSTRLPLLGVIPFQKELKQALAGLTLISHSNGKSPEQSISTNGHKSDWYVASPFLEAFRSLHANIRLLGADTPTSSLIISSPRQADGKSTVAAHLAQAAAAMGQRVLLVDADLRRPQIHEYLGLPNPHGLSNVLANEVKLEEATQQLSAWYNLQVLTAGSLPPDPTRLLSSKRMQHLMEQFKSVFDLVIYDVPPSLGFADSRLLAPYTNGVVLVARLGKTDRSMLRQTLDEFKTARIPVLGLVANGLRNHTDSSYHYYHSYYNQDSSLDKVKKLLQQRLEPPVN